MKKLAAALLCAVLTAPSLAGAETVKIKVLFSVLAGK